MDSKIVINKLEVLTNSFITVLAARKIFVEYDVLIRWRNVAGSIGDRCYRWKKRTTMPTVLCKYGISLNT